MPTTAEQLLSALAPLPFPARLTLTARTARRLADEGTLAPLLTDLDGRGPYERRLAALAAHAVRDVEFLAERLADPDPVVAGYARRAARDLPVPDRAVEAAYDDAPAVLRQRLARLLVAGGRTALAERLVARLRADWGDAEAARLLPACSTPFVARELPGLAHAVDGWTRLASRHPDPVLDHAERTLADRAGGEQRDDWWRLHATTVAALAPLRPERVLTLLERYGPGGLPPALSRGLAPLATADVERLIRWLTSPGSEGRRQERVPPPAALRELVQAAPASLIALGRHWLKRGPHFAALVGAMAPGRRAAFVDAVGGDAAEAVLELLPRERRWAEVRRAAAAFDGTDYWWDDLDILAHGPLDEARPALLAAIGRSDADDRAAAWPLFVACAVRDGGRAAITELLTTAGRRLRNERHPVRAAALGALAEAHPRVFAPADAPLLDAIATDALEARDASSATLKALRTLAVRLLVEHATGDEGETDAGAPRGDGTGAGGATGEGAPRGGRTDGGGEVGLGEWALRVLARITERVGVPDFGELHRELRRGQEHELLGALRPWLDAGAGRADFRLLLGLAAALGPRARRLPELQDRLATAVEHGDDETFEAAARLWLAAPATRDDRAARIVAREPSAVALPPVRDVLSRRRTDLLDALLADTPPHGRFLTDGARRPLPDLGGSDRWLPRQQRAAVRLAGEAVADRTLPLDDRAALIRAAAPVPEFGRALALAHADDPDVVVAEAALGALPRTDRPHDALPTLLDRADGDRARVAVYAADRAARFTAPSRLAQALGPLLTGERPAKVTSRKEAVRLAARFLPPRSAAPLLARAFHAPDRHPDVRAAVVRALPPLLGEPEARALIEEAARDDTGPVHEALLAVTPWELAETHRRAYAAVVLSAYDTSLALAEGFGGHVVLRAMGVWCRYSPELAHRISRTVSDLDDRTHWGFAAWTLRDLAVSELPHPVGGAAPGSVFHSAVAELLAATHTPEGGCDALESRDVPALQRLRHLTSFSYAADVRTELLEAVAGQLTGEPRLAPERAELRGLLVGFATEPTELLERLRDLAAEFEDVGVSVAIQTSERLRLASAHRAPRCADALLTAADGLARDGRTATGLLAAGLVSGMGLSFGWTEEGRSLLRLLRRHADPDVRHQAYRTTTHNE